jgi:hypothetical protein
MSDTKTFADLFPEHAKLEALGGKSQTLGMFLEWLRQHPILTLGYWVQPDDGRHPYVAVSSRTITSVLAEYFEIDHAAFMKEKQEMYDLMRRQVVEKERAK